jgi:hypothetical protein
MTQLHNRFSDEGTIMTGLSNGWQEEFPASARPTNPMEHRG